VRAVRPDRHSTADREHPTDREHWGHDRGPGRLHRLPARADRRRRDEEPGERNDRDHRERRRPEALKAYGTADTAGAPLQPDAHYRIASVSKTFTALAVLRLADEGKAALIDPTSRYVADVPNGDTVTVRNLLDMRSGLFDFTADTAFLDRYKADPTMAWTDDDTVAIVRAHAADATPPDQNTVYNNSNYVLLDYVIEKASGQPAPQYVNGLVCELGLANTSWPADGRPARWPGRRRVGGRRSGVFGAVVMGLSGMS